jgi:diguanylate cyclase (GGDEF)-like protein
MPMLLSLLRCCLWAALLAAAPAMAQSRPGLVSFQRLAMPDDVPAQLSTAMVQDGHGMLWIGTQDGLVRYDGYHYKVYHPRPGDPHALSGSYVRSLLVARDGRLWVGTISGGVSVFDPRTEQFTQYRHDAVRPDSLANDRVESLVEDASGKVWLATDDGLDRFDPASGRFEHWRHEDKSSASLANNQVRALLIDHAGKLWVGTRDGLQHWLGDAAGHAAGSAAFARVGGASGTPDALAGEHITRLYEDSRQRLWIGTVAHGAAVLDPASGQLQRLRPATQLGAASAASGAAAPAASGLSHFWIYAFTEAAPGEMWIGTFGGGIDVVDTTSLRVIDRLHSDGDAASSIGNDRLGALMTDRSGLVWAGTWGGGVAMHDPHTRAFRKLRHSPANADGISHPAVVRALEAADGRLWLGTNGNGVDILDADGHLRDSLRPNPARPDALADGAVTCLAQAADGAMWVATLDGTLHKISAGSGPQHYRVERLSTRQGLPGGPIRTMVFGPDGALWAGSLNGLARIGKDSRISSYRHVPEDPSSLSGREVESLAFAPDGTLWAGTDHGLNAFDTASGKAVRILPEPARSDSLPDNWVPDLMVARDGRLWLATQSGVAILKQWDGHKASFDTLSSRLKLPAHAPESLLQDGEGQVWVGGRVRINPRSWQWRAYDRADGMDFRTVFIASRSMNRNGDLMFGSPEGLLLVRPSLLARWDYQPPVNVSSLSIDGVEQPGAAILAQRVLAPGQQHLRLEFSAQDFSAPQKLHYRYRLEGYDSDWVQVDAGQRVAAYAHLPPGAYQLRIQGSNRNGDWSPAEWRMALTVAPAFYQTWWFRSLLWLLGGLLVFGLFRLRLRQLRRRSARLERTVAERTAALETAYRRIEQASLTDPLTQLHNRRYLEQAIQADFELATRRMYETPPLDDADLILFMLDLDHFKSVNDHYGHAAGDAVLVQTAEVLKRCLRASDHVVRWGGEEFLLVARFVNRREGPMLAEKIRAAIAAHAFQLPCGTVLHKTTSIGFACYPFAPGQPTPATLDTLQRMADTALYAAKRGWRDAWVGVAPAQVRDEGAELAVRRFLADAEAAVAEGRMQIYVAAENESTLRWH